MAMGLNTIGCRTFHLGPIVAKAQEFAQQLQNPKTAENLKFTKIIPCNIGYTFES